MTPHARPVRYGFIYSVYGRLSALERGGRSGAAAPPLDRGTEIQIVVTYYIVGDTAKTLQTRLSTQTCAVRRSPASPAAAPRAGSPAPRSGPRDPTADVREIYYKNERSGNQFTM